MCPLDVAGDTVISRCEDSHSLSFAVSLYMLSIENCSASPKMDASEIVVSNFTRLLMKWTVDSWYISIVQ